MARFKGMKLLGNHRKALLFYVIKMHTLQGLSESQVEAAGQHQVRMKGNTEKGQGSGRTLWEPGGGSSRVGPPPGTPATRLKRPLHLLGKFQSVKAIYLLLNFPKFSRTPREKSLDSGNCQQGEHLSWTNYVPLPTKLIY